MDEVLGILVTLGVILFGIITIGASIANEDTAIDIKQIEKTSEICTKANSTISKISKTTVICVNGGEFKYE